MNSKKILLILGLAGFVVMADNWVVSPILPSISKDIGVDIASSALIITAYMVPFGLFQLIFGYLADKFGKRQVISFSMVFFTIATALCALGSGLTDLVIYRALTGIFAASVMPVSMALIGDIFPINERQSAIGTFLGISFLGQGLSMLLGGSIAYFLNWRGVFAVYALLSVIATVLLLTVGKKIPSSKSETSQVLTPYINLITNPLSLKIYLLVLFEGFLLMGIFSFLGGFIKTTYDFNNFMIGLIMTVFGLMAVAGGRISGKIASRVGRKKTILIGLICTLVGNLIFILLGNVLAIFIIGVGLLGLGLMLAHSTFLTIATGFAERWRGVAMSLVAFCMMGGGGLGTAIGSRIVGNSSYLTLFSVYGIGLIVLILAVLLVKKSFMLNSVELK
ncbi:MULTISPECIES: MFS transporter [unclassified Dehalobacter]|jgi:Arabinose efflux permease|uniref:MFS transporter n=1 Tax=unclassified Dehalobacter TaxID=2635733 RepID=UPI00028BB3BB|nr:MULTISPECIES: MFS transporter [unclassified Dehalobacter]AFV01200.1 Permease, MDR related, probably tetracycline resistance protein [Dehalobacter sp. DCA]AFV04241.1 Permease, MDR related, probably tetracycline resistance protein [Dehalobacter sp. CF]